MKFNLLTPFVLLARSAIVLGAPVEAPVETSVEATIEARDETAPSVADIKKDIASKVHSGTSIFYTGSTGPAARKFGKAHGLTWLQLTDTATRYEDPQKWGHNYNTVINNWSQAFAELSTETVWVTFKTLDRIDPSRDSVWNKYEYPALKRAAVREIIQVSAADTTKQVQIWPVDVRSFPSNKCKWHGAAPVCQGSCPDKTHQVAKSLYGPDTNKCVTGEKVYCCEN